MLVGFTLGSIFSGGLIVQDKLAYSIRKRDAAEAAAKAEEEANAAALAPPLTEADSQAALEGSAMADAAGEMGWIDWALLKTGLGGKPAEMAEQKAAELAQGEKKEAA